MSRCYRPLLMTISIFIGTLFFISTITLTLIGALDLADKYHRVYDYTNDTCQVNSRDYKTYSCSSKYATYTCYGPKWEVFYGVNQTIFAEIETDERYSTIHEAFHKAKQYEIGQRYSCWYDTKRSSHAQWPKPTITSQIILLSCGSGSLLISILFFYITYRLRKA